MKYKLLKGVAHDWAASFNSTLNYCRTDYAMGHLSRIAVETGTPDFQLNLLSGKAIPEIFLSEDVKRCLAKWVPKFEEILKKVIPDAAGAVTAATFRVHFNLQEVGRSTGLAKYDVPCTLSVSIVDRNGKTHIATINDKWRVSR